MAETISEIITTVRLDYTHTAGRAQNRFLTGLIEGKIRGQRCPSCKKVYVPPRGSCAVCAVATEEEVEVADKGTVTTFCIVNLQFHGQAVEVPYVCGSVLLDGADLPFFGMLAGVEVDKVHMGQRVQAVWVPPEERKPSFDNIRYFEPIDEPDAPFESYKDHL